MIRKSNKQKILGVFFDEPTRPHQLREIGKRTGIGLPSVKRYIEELAKEGVLRKETGPVFPYFVSNRESRIYKRLRAADTALRLEESGFIEALEEIYPDCIVLFGSAARGEDVEKSDIDVFVQAKEKAVDLKKVEKATARKINLVFEPDTGRLPPEFKNNLANGIVLSGFLRLV